jgi:hypothetical protein
VQNCLIVVHIGGQSGHHWVNSPATCHSPSDYDLLEFVRVHNMRITLKYHEIGELADRD